MNNAVFEETMKNVRKHRDIKLVTTEARRNYLVSEPTYHTHQFNYVIVLSTQLPDLQKICWP